MKIELYFELKFEFLHQKCNCRKVLPHEVVIACSNTCLRLILEGIWEKPSGLDQSSAILLIVFFLVPILV